MYNDDAVSTHVDRAILDRQKWRSLHMVDIICNGSIKEIRDSLCLAWSRLQMPWLWFDSTYPPLDKVIIECRMIEEQANACWLCRAEQPVKTVVDVLGNVFYNRS